MSPYPLLFSPLKLGKHEVKNRIVFPPAASVTGVVTDLGLAWYERIARGGVGAIIVESVALKKFHEPGFVERLPLLAETIHRHGVFACVQLFQPPQLPDGAPVSVSGDGDARAATEDEIEAMAVDFAYAATACCDAGFDAVEPHGAHGFFLNQFFSPKTNTRKDSYGGDLEGRMRFGIETVRAVRAAIGPDRVIFYRHTPEQADAYALADSLVFAGRLEGAGLDVLDVSPSTHNVTPHDKKEPVGQHAGLAEAFRDVVKCPIMAVGGMNDPAAAERVLQRGKVQLVGICRGLIADSELPRKVAEGRLDEIVRCVECNKKCFGNLAKGVPIACTQWKKG